MVRKKLTCVNCYLDFGNMNLSQGHDMTVWYIIKMKHGGEELWPRKFFGICVLWLWPRQFHLGLWSWHNWVMENNCVKYYSDPTWQRGIMAGTRILGMCVLWHWHWRYDLGSRSWHTLGAWTKSVRYIIQIELGSEEIWSGQIFSICALWPWPWRYDLRSRSWHRLVEWTISV